MALAEQLKSGSLLQTLHNAALYEHQRSLPPSPVSTSKEILWHFSPLFSQSKTLFSHDGRSLRLLRTAGGKQSTNIILKLLEVPHTTVLQQLWYGYTTGKTFNKNHSADCCQQAKKILLQGSGLMLHLWRFCRMPLPGLHIALSDAESPALSAAAST